MIEAVSQAEALSSCLEAVEPAFVAAQAGRRGWPLGKQLLLGVRIELRLAGIRVRLRARGLRPEERRLQLRATRGQLRLGGARL